MFANFKIFICQFIYGSFNDAGSVSVFYIRSIKWKDDIRVKNQNLCLVIIWNIILLSTWSDWGEPQKPFSYDNCHPGKYSKRAHPEYKSEDFSFSKNVSVSMFRKKKRPST